MSTNNSKIVAIDNGIRYLTFTRGNGTTWNLDKDDFITVNYRNDVSKVFVKYRGGLLELDQDIITTPFTETAQGLADILLSYVNGSGAASDGKASEATLQQIYQDTYLGGLSNEMIIERLDRIIRLLEKIYV